ncbi:Protein bric-a-brac 1 like protein [Argiope bruennichi]|nr:Protein bric-a-brac 1 like protein [Argiope bruennichi]
MFTISNNLPSLKSDKFQQMRAFPPDCTLVCKNGRVTAHRLVLSAASTFFMTSIAQSSGGHIFLPQYDVQDIRQIVDFIYGQSVTIDYDRMSKLVDIANDLGINVFANPKRS